MREGATHPKPSSSARGTDLGDEYLFYDREGDRVHVLNATAREIFLMCDGTRSVDEIVRLFAERFELDEATARKDAEQTLGRLHELGVLA